MKGVVAFVLVVLIAVGGYFAYISSYTQNPPETPRDVVETFGARMKDVSLLAQRAQLEQDMRAAYGPLVAPELIAEWLQNPQKAPGRLASSPWPDRIEVRSVEQIGEGEVYYVEGEIIEVTNEGGGIGESPTEASRRPVIATVVNTADGWRITELTLGAYPGDGEWVYTEPNAQGLQWMYPKVLPTSYISAVAPEGWPASTRDDSSTRGWPPRVTFEGGADYSCAEQDEIMIGDRAYCVVVASEGAAGSVYRTYEYIIAQGDFLVRVKFTLRFPQCANYGEEEQLRCESEQATFDIDGLADRIASSIRML